MAGALTSPKADEAIKKEYALANFFSRYVDRFHKNWQIIHSTCDVKRSDLERNVIEWKDTPYNNAVYGDIRIARKDEHGRVVEPFVYIDLKYTDTWDYASITFPKTRDFPKYDAMKHLNMIGKGVEKDFYYVSWGKAGIRVFSLDKVKKFVSGADESDMLRFCTEGKFNSRPSWFISLVNLSFSSEPEVLLKWLDTTVSKRLG